MKKNNVCAHGFPLIGIAASAALPLVTKLIKPLIKIPQIIPQLMETKNRLKLIKKPEPCYCHECNMKKQQKKTKKRSVKPIQNKPKLK